MFSAWCNPVLVFAQYVGTKVLLTFPATVLEIPALPQNILMFTKSTSSLFLTELVHLLALIQYW